MGKLLRLTQANKVDAQAFRGVLPKLTCPGARYAKSGTNRLPGRQAVIPPLLSRSFVCQVRSVKRCVMAVELVM